MKIAAKIIGAIVGIGGLALTVFLAWIGFGACLVVNDQESDDLVYKIAHRMQHPLE